MTSFTVAIFVTSIEGDWVSVVWAQSFAAPVFGSSALSEIKTLEEITLASISRQLFNWPLSIAAWSKVNFPWYVAHSPTYKVPVVVPFPAPASLIPDWSEDIKTAPGGVKGAVYAKGL